MQKLKKTELAELYENANDGDIIEVGELKLKRTVIKNACCMSLHLRYDDYLVLTSNAMFSGLTVDEYVRRLIIDNIKECS